MNMINDNKRRNSFPAGSLRAKVHCIYSSAENYSDDRSGPMGARRRKRSRILARRSSIPPRNDDDGLIRSYEIKSQKSG